MPPSRSVEEYIHSLMNSRRLGSQVVCHRRIAASSAAWAAPRHPLSEKLTAAMTSLGIPGLFSHQARALDSIRDGRHVVVATPTASGKTLIYHLAFARYYLAQPASRALFLFPLKALAQDQLVGFERFVRALQGPKPTAAIYDGDTSAWRRKKIREQPPNVMMTNPEMLHLSFLAHHRKWQSFFADLKLVVVDEVHTYRGVMGAHMAQVFRRLLRICDRYGAQPVFIFNSATVANPSELSQQLTGVKVEKVAHSGAPQGKRHTLLLDPFDGPAQSTILLLHAALKRKLRTIVYTQSRKMTELIAIWAKTRASEFADRISAYRAGFLPQERRDIEAKLAEGSLLAVISTSALELGIDIGRLDLCLLVGYPGTVVSTLQRGGRVGRSGRESAVILIAGEDALDQYFIRHPDDFFDRPPEAAVVNPYNPEILGRHLLCAAAETPLTIQEPFLRSRIVKQAAGDLEATGMLLRSAAGDQWFAARKNPQRRVDLRGTGRRFQIIGSQDGENKGEIDGLRAFKETHTGAVYLHRGQTYLVDELALETHTVYVTPSKVDFYTRVRASKHTEIVEVRHTQRVWRARVAYGIVRVTEKITGFDRWRIRTKTRIGRETLDLPEQTFVTQGLWFSIPASVQRAAEARYLHFMGGIHAMEHALIGMFPLQVMADRNDLGGIATPFHPQVNSPAVFVYDAVAGGAGLSRQAFCNASDLLSITLKAVDSCPCDNGCPSCVHSPKCGSGNRPIDKKAAVFILEKMKSSAATAKEGDAVSAPDDPPPVSQPSPSVEATQKAADTGGAAHQAAAKERPAERAPFAKSRTAGRRHRRQLARLRKQRASATVLKSGARPATGLPRFGVFDLETQLSAREVGGWHKAHRMRVSCAVLYDSFEDRYLTYMEADIPQLIQRFAIYDWVVGFNSIRFDYRVLSAYSPVDFSTLPSLDILEEVKKHLGYRLSLDHLASATLGQSKTADGLKALQWWREGKIPQLLDYCRHDVHITWNILQFGLHNGYLLFTNKAGHKVRLPVDWPARFGDVATSLQ